MIPIAVKQLLCSLVASSAYITLGVLCAWPATALPSIRDSLDYKLSLESQSWIGSSASFGALVGTIFSGLVASWIGARKILVYCGLMSTTGWFLVFLSSQFSFIPLIYPSLALMGSSVGLATPMASVYITELVGSGNKGMVTSMFNFNLTLGVLVTHLVGALTTWYYTSLVITLTHLLLAVALLLLPATPYELARNDKLDKLSGVLRNWRHLSTEVIDVEVTIVQKAVQSESEKSSIFEFMRGLSRKGAKNLVILLFIITFGHLSGISPMTAYLVDIFSVTGISKLTLVMVSGISEVVFSFLQMLVADSLGRKTFLIISSFLTLISTLMFAGIFWRYSHTPDTSTFGNEFLDSLFSSPYLVIVCLAIYFLAFNIGYGPMKYTIFAELFSPKEQEYLTGIIHTTYWLESFFLVKMFLLMIDQLGSVAIFLGIASIQIISLVFIQIFVPETRSKMEITK